VEATLDFPEEDIDSADRADALARLTRLRAHAARALERARAGSVLRTGLGVVIAGQPNVGKSSLLNRLAGEELAIVTAIPGTTRDAVRQTILIDGVPINVVDTAGLRETRDEVESIGIERAWESIQRADLVLLVVDARCGVTREDEAIAARLPARLKRLTVFNKIDLGKPPRCDAQGSSLAVSARTGQGLGALRAALLEAAGWQPGAEDVFMARERHVRALAEAGEYLSCAETRIAQPELFAEELRLAQRELNTITGEFGADDLLGQIFAKFCIGK
jgi:tRNA modification GTPase